MADYNAEVFTTTLFSSEKWKPNASLLFNEYPKVSFPDTLKPSTGKKGKMCLFEDIDMNFYEKNARMVAFKTSAERLPAWV